MSKTIAQQLNITDFPFQIKDKEGRVIYYEYSNQYWERWERDSDGNERYYEDSHLDWERKEYDSNGKVIYHETSEGVIIDNRPKETIKSTWSIRDCFKELRMSKHNHLGLGDIRLTVAQQDEICYLVESLIEKSKTTEQ